MSTLEQITEKLKLIKEETILNQILEMVTLELEMSQKIMTLSDAQKAAIQEGIDDIEAGRTFSHTEVNHQIEGWLKEK
ncbi:MULTISPECIES: hypothetical protein [Reichenbachiella]|uniref:Uncharacterized protein n=1 Tax=Reichenbachiella agariperforans TaxID=156994 RepID=A0A1M6NKM3_REIAG|nr:MULTISPECIES: hypothetical protein [Reichenbachiella]MBU2915915.1 hypothetical protein [Reichenbachiella agariperforans]RJE71829.1 hypothetical protein BGP76_07000 [Reichenbachiella sp. MSK19-1]SHJ96267.1 hypothetical protein SAMN04488028_102295 [Reichenbachiella agariperforans]